MPFGSPGRCISILRVRGATRRRSLKGGQHLADDPLGRFGDVSRSRRVVPHFRMLTARARTSAVVERAMALCRAINDFAHRDSGIVSVGENAMTLVKLV